MRYLRQNTATRVTVGPFLDPSDGVTPETALTVTNCHLTLVVDSSGVPTLVLDADATASGGNNDMVHVTNDDAGFYDLELTAAQLNYVGRAMLAITDATNHCPVFHEFMLVPANVYDSLFLGSDYLDVEVATLVAAVANKVADHIIRRTNSNVEGSSDGDTLGFRSLYGVIATFTNKIYPSGSDVLITKADDSTTLGTRAATTDSGADPITALDTA